MNYTEEDYTEDEIRMLMMDKLAGTISAADDAVLDRLLAQDPQTVSLWHKLNRDLNVQARADKLKGIQQKVWGQLNQRTQGAHQHPQGHGYSWYLIRVAAAACVVGLVGTMAWQWTKTRHTQPIAAVTAQPEKNGIQLKLAGGQTIDISNAGSNIQLKDARIQNKDKTLSFDASTASTANNNSINTLTVPVGLDYKMVLADGTQVWLNSATAIQFPFAFTGNTREITLRGEAYLKVAPDATRPFLVHLANSTVQVLGTEFNVNSYDSGIVKVSLVKGLVKLSSAGKNILVHPGLEGTLSGQENLSLHSFDEADVLSWMKGIHVFYNATLQDISNVLPRWYGIKVVLDNPSSAGERFSGYIDRHQPIQDFLENLRSTGTADFYFKGDVLHFK